MYGTHVDGTLSSPSHPLKRRQSKSPSPPSKRRAPPSYIPSLYQPSATSAPALPTFGRSLSLEAQHGGTPASERSSPGLDWLKRTEDLHLVTPVGSVREGEGDAEMDTDSHMQAASSSNMEQGDEEDAHTLAYSPLPAMPLSRSSTASPFDSLRSGPAPPHDAPPLHYHLAGSPSMTRSSSSSSSHHGGGAATGFLGHSSSGQVLTPLPSLAYDHHSDVDNDVSMGSTLPPPYVQAQSPGAAATAAPAPGGKGGWKITMGFRSDCEKCQQRVPGHYTHVVYNS